MKLTPILAVAVAAAVAMSGWLYSRENGEGPLAGASVAAQSDDPEHFGPGPEPVDLFHPDRARPVQPAYGGTLTVHLNELPKNLNGMLTSLVWPATLRLELHAALVTRDWESWEFVPELASSWEVADREVPEEPEEKGRIDSGTVFTFHLRENVRWHDGHPFDAEDVLFSWRLARNPDVQCDSVRSELLKIESAEALDRHTVRFTFAEQYFNSLGMLADDFCILPRHLYDLRDPDHPGHDAAASDEACAREVNENPHNTEWVGLGPYRLTKYSEQGIEAERFPDFFDPEQSGHVDRIVWRHIASDTAAFQALLNGELDFTLRLTSDQYFGPETQQPAFTARCTKGYFYLGSFNYTPWNMRRPILADVKVRKALAHAVDMDTYVQTLAHGLAQLPTGFQCFFGPAYDRDVKRLPFDLERSAELFAEAGWYDRDGDGVIDKDGKPFEIELLVQSGNVASERWARMYQETLAKVGARLKLTTVDNATYFKRVIYERDFDAGGGGWSVDATENDPMQLWHSSSAVPGGSNHAGVDDPHVDELIERGQRELDDEKRWAIWRELHRYLYEEVQPYLYRDIVPRKFALNKALRGVQFFKVSPGYSLRRWYYPAGTPGTRETREKK